MTGKAPSRCRISGGRILHLNSEGKLRIFSGNGEKGFAGDGLEAAKAVYNGMHSVVRASNGDLYVSDTRNNLIRKIDGKTNITSTLAGVPGEKGFSGDGGLASRAKLADPISISLSPDGKTLLIADIHNKRIRGVDLQSGLIRTLAGNGKKGVPEDGEKATGQPLTDPQRPRPWMRRGTFTSSNAGATPLRVVRPDGEIFTLAGTGRKGPRTALPSRPPSPVPSTFALTLRARSSSQMTTTTSSASTTLRPRRSRPSSGARPNPEPSSTVRTVLPSPPTAPSGSATAGTTAWSS